MEKTSAEDTSADKAEDADAADTADSDTDEAAEENKEETGDEDIIDEEKEADEEMAEAPAVSYPSITFDDGESLELYDVEWTLDYKCDNGFLNKMEVNCTKRTMAQALQSELVSGYYVAVLSGQPSSYAYIDKPE